VHLGHLQGKYPDVSLDRLRENLRNLNQDSQKLGRDSNLTPPNSNLEGCCYFNTTVIGEKYRIMDGILVFWFVKKWLLM
jgi:hypothetical protein